MGKSIFIFNDGTKQTLGSKYNSNVSKIYKIMPGKIKKRNDLLCGQFKEDESLNYISLYYRGIGTKELRQQDSSLNKPKNFRQKILNALMRFINMLTGIPIVNRVESMINDIEALWQPGDKIYLVGFSRGAAAVRLVAHYINNLIPDIEIEYMLVFDTVYSVSAPIKILNFEEIKHFNNKNIGTHIKKCDHLISGDEMREKFPLTPINTRENVRQILFSGCHSDVGGGVKGSGLSGVSLEFSINKLKSLGVIFNEGAIKNLNILPNPKSEISWDKLGGTAQTHFPRDFKKIDFIIHQSVAERSRAGKGVPVALAQLAKFKFGNDELIEFDEVITNLNDRMDSPPIL